MNNSDYSVDIITVTYNSEKWIENYLRSFKESDVDLESIYFHFVDNASTDNTVDILYSELNRCDIKRFNFHELDENRGFGYANNHALPFCMSQFIFFLNIDTEIQQNTFKEMFLAIEANDMPNIAAFELRQIPHEHPKYYNPVNLNVSWASAAALIVKRNILIELGGFDENIFLYCEDVDLSWRMRSNGYKIKYIPNAVVLHKSYDIPNEIKPNQIIFGIYNNLMLRYRYGSFAEIITGYIYYFYFIFKRNGIEHARRLLIKKIIKSFSDGFLFRGGIFSRYRHMNFNFYRFDYEITRDGAFYFNKIPQKCLPLVSIIVRTHKRVEVLKETLYSLKNQTYRNFEIIIVEDGENFSEEMLKKEFSFLNIKYHSTVKKVGRSIAGNIGLSLAQGEYINFLDDDDLFFSDHIEVLAYELSSDHLVDAVYSTAFETPIIVHSYSPYKYSVNSKYVKYRNHFSKTQLFHGNLFPIQSVMFKRKLYEKYGGFDNAYDSNEDWDLWLRYAQNSKFKLIEKTTSIYRVPAEYNQYKKRIENFSSNYFQIQDKYRDIYFPTKPELEDYTLYNKIDYQLSIGVNETLKIYIQIQELDLLMKNISLLFYTEGERNTYLVDIFRKENNFTQEIPLSLIYDLNIEAFSLLWKSDSTITITTPCKFNERKLLPLKVKIKRLLKKNSYIRYAGRKILDNMNRVKEGM